MQCADRDAHGRVPANSLYVVRNGLSDRPYVDEWALRMAQELEAQWPGLHTKYVDSTRTLSPWIWTTSSAMLADRSCALLAPVRRIFSEVHSEKSRNDGPCRPVRVSVRTCAATYCGNSAKPWIVWSSSSWSMAGRSTDNLRLHWTIRMRFETIQGATLFAEVGIHPSYRSSDEAGLLRQETESLGPWWAVWRCRGNISCAGVYPTPCTRPWRMVSQKKHSLGFSDRLGFRASTCTPFRWFDVEKQTKRRDHSGDFAAMDSALIDHQRCMPRDVVERMSAMGELVRQVNGNFVSVWHDRSLSGHLGVRLLACRLQRGGPTSGS